MKVIYRGYNDNTSPEWHIDAFRIFIRIQNPREGRIAGESVEIDMILK